jgi:hypothetical protein
MDKKQNNVIKFPTRGRFITDPVTEEQVASNVNMVKHTHVNETLQTVIPLLFSNIEMAGFDLSVDYEEDDSNIKDGTLIVEAVRSILCKYYNLYHPLQDVADQIFYKEEDGVFAIVDNINIEFQKNNGNEID